MNDILHNRMVDYKKIHSFEEQLTAFASWTFDIQLKESFRYLNHFKATRGIFFLLEKHIEDRVTVSLIEEKVTNFIQDHIN